MATTLKEKLQEKSVLFKSVGEAAREHSEIVRYYLGSVVPSTDNMYAALNGECLSWITPLACDPFGRFAFSAPSSPDTPITTH